MKTLIPFLAILLLVSCNLKTTNSVSSTENTEIETENIDSNDPKSVALVSEPEKLLSKGSNEYEFYLNKEDKIHIVYNSEKNISNFSIKNLDSGNDFFVIKKPHNNLDTSLTINRRHSINPKRSANQRTNNVLHWHTKHASYNRHLHLA